MINETNQIKKNVHLWNNDIINSPHVIVTSKQLNKNEDYNYLGRIECDKI